jgi:hypothetical protein
MKLSAGIAALLITLLASPLYAAVPASPAKVNAAPATATPAAAPAKTAPAADAKTDIAASDTATTDAGVVIAQAIWVKGDMTAAQPNAAPRALTRRSAIYEHDTITTAKDTTGQIAFSDGSMVSFNPDSVFKIDEYNYKKGGATENKAVMNLVKGGFRTITGAIPKENPEGYKMNTPVATIGVRGTEYVTVLSPVKGLLLKIEKGTIKVANAAGDIDLTECLGAEGTCNSYGVVTSFDIRPDTTNKMPSELANVAPVTPLPAGLGVPGSGPGGVGPAKGNEGGKGGSGPAKAVGNFCVGLLQDFYHNIQKFFG